MILELNTSQTITHLQEEKNATDFVINRVVTILSKVRPFSDKDVILDIGPGNGLFFKKIHSKVKRCVGVEASAGVTMRLVHAFKNYKNVFFCRAFSMRLPFRDKYFDYIVMNSVIHILRNKKEVIDTLKEIRRVSKDHSLIFIGEVPTVSYDEEHKIFQKKDTKNIIAKCLIFVKRRLKYLIYKGEPIILPPRYQLYFPTRKFIRLCETSGFLVRQFGKTVFPKGELETRYDYILEPR